jgi:hypothetical protein
VVGRYARTELVVVDLCRYRDHAETDLARAANVQDSWSIRALAPADLSA